MTQKQCASCAKITPRVYQQGKCRDCLIKDLQELRPLIDFYREPANFPNQRSHSQAGSMHPDRKTRRPIYGSLNTQESSD
jgi:hypothetical protein